MAADVDQHLHQLSGRYQLGPILFANVTVENGQVFIQVTGQPRIEMQVDGDYRFSIPSVGASVKFAVQDGRCTQLVLVQHGRVMRARRVADVPSVTAVPSAIAVAAKDLLRLVGEYAFSSHVTMSVTVDNSRLYAQIVGQAKYELHPLTACEYFLKEVDARVKFSLADDEAIELCVQQFGAEQYARRVA